MSSVFRLVASQPVQQTTMSSDSWDRRLGSRQSQRDERRRRLRALRAQPSSSSSDEEIPPEPRKPSKGIELLSGRMGSKGALIKRHESYSHYRKRRKEEKRLSRLSSQSPQTSSQGGAVVSSSSSSSISLLQADKELKLGSRDKEGVSPRFPPHKPTSTTAPPIRQPNNTLPSPPMGRPTYSSEKMLLEAVNSLQNMDTPDAHISSPPSDSGCQPARGRTFTAPRDDSLPGGGAEPPRRLSFSPPSNVVLCHLPPPVLNVQTDGSISRRAISPSDSGITSTTQPSWSLSSSSSRRPLSSASADWPSDCRSSESLRKRRNSDFMTKYEELSRRAATALKLADSLVTPSTSQESPTYSSMPQDEAQDDDNEVLAQDFNEEEVLKQCHDFLQLYHKSKNKSQAPEALPRRRFSYQNEESRVTASAHFAGSTPNPDIRHRSSSLTPYDGNSAATINIISEEKLKPILKRPSEENPVLIEGHHPESTSSHVTSILKPTKKSEVRMCDDCKPTSNSSKGGILKKKSYSLDEGEVTSSSLSVHINESYISPKHENRSSVLKSRHSSACSSRACSPDSQSFSILKSSATSREDLTSDPVVGILKKKKKKSHVGSFRNSSEASDDLLQQGHSNYAVSSILKKQGSMDDLDYSSDEARSSGVTRARSILKRRPGSTDEDFDEFVSQSGHCSPQSNSSFTKAVDSERPKSILKGRKSAESSNSRQRETLSWSTRSRSCSPTGEDLTEQASGPGPWEEEPLEEKPTSAKQTGELAAASKSWQDPGYLYDEGIAFDGDSKDNLGQPVLSPQNLTNLPPIVASSNGGRRGGRRRSQNGSTESRFKTQPITVDEVQEASKKLVPKPILKTGGGGLGASSPVVHVSRRRSILKLDSFERDSVASVAFEADLVTPRPILKSLDSDQSVPPTKPSSPTMSSQSSSGNTSSTSREDDEEDENNPFRNVIIDPVPDVIPIPDENPGAGYIASGKATPQSHKRKGLTLEAAASVHISSDDPNLAQKLAELSLEADHLKQEGLLFSDQQEVALRRINAHLNNDQWDAEGGGAGIPPRKQDTNSEGNSREPDITTKMDRGKVPGGGIAERLAALQKSGEENWKKRVTPKAPVISNFDDNKPGLDILNANVVQNTEEQAEPVQLRRNQFGGQSARPVTIHDRLSQLQVSQQSWHKKVAEKDASNFTVAGKMDKHLRRLSMQEQSSKSESATGSKSGIQREAVKCHEHWKDIASPEHVNFRGDVFDLGANELEDLAEPDNDDSEDQEDIVHVGFEQTADMSLFFGTAPNTASEEEPTDDVQHDLKDEDLDLLCSTATVGEKLSHPKRIARPGRQRAARNPVKHLANRALKGSNKSQDKNDNGEEDIAQSSPKAERHVTTNRNSVDKHAHLAAEAKAGLASTEDFSIVRLKSKEEGISRLRDMAPYKELMLMQLKGRRFCQPRMVPPVASSVNSGDAYILVTTREVFVWMGRFSNVIERSRSTEIAQAIVRRKDLGYRGDSKSLRIIDESQPSGSSYLSRKFWKILGKAEDEVLEPQPAGHSDEDAMFETCVNKVTMAWEVCLSDGHEDLKPLPGLWGNVPKVEFLDPSKVVVLDFGSEVYVWTGSNAKPGARRAGIHLAKLVWNKKVLSEYPISHLSKGDERPSWGLCAKVSQKMETVLFREKFIDWPDEALTVIKLKESKKQAGMANSSPSDAQDNAGAIDFDAFDASVLVDWEESLEDPNLELEGSCLGRGLGYYDSDERRQYEISTLSKRAWLVNEHGAEELDIDWKGHFYSADTYVIRWQYQVSLTGRDLKGRPSKHAAVGRDRTAYFFWQGNDSKTSEKGTSALMAVGLDKEESPQIRVVEGKEEAAFLNLWAGEMIVHRGKSGSSNSRALGWKLYLLRGETSREAMLLEVPCEAASLRSRGCFILINSQKSKIIVWRGKAAPEHIRDIARERGEHLARNSADDLNMTSSTVSVSIVEEEDEDRELTTALNVGQQLNWRNAYMPNFIKAKSTPRLFHFTGISGSMEVKEVLCPFRRVDVVNALPFEQQDLYDAEQPALFFLATSETCWLWQGYFPSQATDDAENGNNQQSNNMTGSGLVRWHALRRAAMQTAENYLDLRYSGTKRSCRPSSRLVWAGCEPMEFTNLFPHWIHHDHVEELNREFFKADDCMTSTLSELSRQTYSWNELQQRPLPDGVDPTRLERYLNDDDFTAYLGVSREDFESAPRWKQLEIRKTKGLF